MNYGQNSFKSSLVFKILISVLAVIVAVIIGIIVFCSSLLGSDKIYDGVYVSGENLGGLTQEEASTLLKEQFVINADGTLTLSCEGMIESFPVSEIEPYLDAELTASSAHAYARYGSVLSRLKQILALKETPVNIPISVKLNDDVLYEYTDKLTEGVGYPMEELSAEINGDILTVKKGKPGMEVNRKTAKAMIAEALSDNKYEVNLSLEEVYPADTTPEEIYDRFYTDAKDASYELVDGEIVYNDSVTGVHFDKTTAKKAVDEAEISGEISFNVTVIEPDVTVDSLKEKMFRDRLATYSSKYNEGVYGRSHNVKLASSNINGTILLPGQEFSYNDVVGPRTVARGFKEANVYVGDEVEVGIGGGICQVSSTLFNSVVMSGLTIVTRTSHSLPVSYVPAGRDATVSYGSIDFKFSNPYDMPIKIVASASGGVNTVAIYGTNNNPERKISFETELVKTIPYETKRTEDPSLPEGTVKVEQEGVNGAVYNTYKVITENGNVLSRTYLTKSNYRATAKKEIIGTGPADAPVTSENIAEETETNTETPEIGEDNGTFMDEESIFEEPVGNEETPADEISEIPQQEETPSIVPVPNNID